jgi:hypothetical protein
MPVQFTINMISLHAETVEEVTQGLAACEQFLTDNIAANVFPSERMAKMKVLLESLAKEPPHWVLGLGGKRNHGVRTTSRNEGENAAQAKNVNVHSRAKLTYVSAANKTRLNNRNQTSLIVNERRSRKRPGGGKQAIERKHIYDQLGGIVLTHYGEGLLLEQVSAWEKYELVFVRSLLSQC